MANINTKREKRALLFANYSAIEPLGLLHLAGAARDEGWARKIMLIKDNDFSDLHDLIADYKPDVVGANIYTGWHNQAGEAFERIRQDNPGIITIAGGPQPTYSPLRAAEFADFVVMSEGFGAFKRILRGEAGQGGILTTPKISKEELQRLGLENPSKHPDRIFPLPDREGFYADYPEHAKSKIKSMITMTGCPYSCTYCYNSSTPGDIDLPDTLAQQLATSLGTSGRLFPSNVREMEDILREGREIAENWPAEVIYFQDDVFGFDDKKGGTLEQMANRWPDEVGMPFHAQMRFEMTSSDKRLELIRLAGGFGLTLAIESADPVHRAEILDRRMKDQIVQEGVKKILDDYGFRLRTEQISALPTGTTSVPTPINLEADLGILKYNMDLMNSTQNGRENMMAWLSTFAPYVGTKLGNLAIQEGFYHDENNGDVPDTFFNHSVLKFMSEWAGPEIAQLRKNAAMFGLKANRKTLSREQVEAAKKAQEEYDLACQKLREDDSAWLSEEENEHYRRQNGEFRKKFSAFLYVPEGDELARNYLTNMGEPYSYERLGREIEAHLNTRTDKISIELREKIASLRRMTSTSAANFGESRVLSDLAAYFAVLPNGEESMERFVAYGRSKGYSAGTLTDSTRHGLYEDLLYSNTGKKDKDLSAEFAESC